jgi:hypothetical protein
MIIADPELHLELARRVSGIELRLGQFDIEGVIAELNTLFPQHSGSDVRETLTLFLELRQVVYDTREKFYLPQPGEYASEADYDMRGMTEAALAQFPNASRDAVYHVVKKCVYWMHLR